MNVKLQHIGAEFVAWSNEKMVSPGLSFPTLMRDNFRAVFSLSKEGMTRAVARLCDGGWQSYSAY